jgi:endonuclease YncB( thermonuclease family)
MWGSVAGVLFFATLIVVAVAGIAAATIFHDDPAAEARELQYDQCYNGGQNCVVDGGTIYVAGEKVIIARVDAPRIQGARCPEERDRGIDTAVRLANLLNSGEVTLGVPYRDPYGRQVRAVQVKGDDVASRMISTGLAHEYLGGKSSWCGSAG